MGAAHPMNKGMDLATLQMQDRLLIDESVFSDNFVNIMASLLNTMHKGPNRFPPAPRTNPFSKWKALGSPVDDLSWLAFGYDLKMHTYQGEPNAYGYPMEDGGKIVADCQRLVKIIDGLTHVPDCANTQWRCPATACSVSPNLDFRPPR